MLLVERVRSAIRDDRELPIRLKNRLVVTCGQVLLCRTLSENRESSINVVDGIEHAFVEKTTRGVRPDVLLEGADRAFGLEVFVTSPVTDRKLASLQIAEFRLSDMDDLKKVSAGDWTEGEFLSVFGVDEHRAREEQKVPEVQGSAVISLRDRCSRPGSLTYSYRECVQSVRYRGEKYRSNIVKKRTVDIAQEYEGAHVAWRDDVLSVNLRSRHTGKQLRIVVHGQLAKKPRGVDVVYVDSGAVVAVNDSMPIPLEQVRRQRKTTKKEVDIDMPSGNTRVLCYGYRDGSHRATRFEINAESLHNAVKSRAVKVIFIEAINAPSVT